MNTKISYDRLSHLVRMGLVLLWLAIGLAGCEANSVPTLNDPEPNPDTITSTSSEIRHNRVDEGQRIGLSLRILMQEARNALDAGQSIPADLNHMMGMSWLEGFVLDEMNEDIILVGRIQSERQPLHLDDVVVTLRNIWHREPYPYCSLDPRPKDVMRLQRVLSEGPAGEDFESLKAYVSRAEKAWGPQQVVLGGVPRNSRHAHVLIDADYHMKRISQSLAQMDGVTSSMDRAIKRFQQAIESGESSAMSTGSSMSRFWFHVKAGDPTFRESGGIVLLNNCAINVLTERQKATKTGELFDSGEEDSDALAFAREISEHLEIGATEPVFQDLENLYRLHALMKAMYARGSVARANLDLEFFLKRYRYQEERPMRPYRDGLTNSEAIQARVAGNGYIREYLFLPLVVGGASMKMTVSPDKFDPDLTKTLERLRIAVVTERPHRDALYWLIEA